MTKDTTATPAGRERADSEPLASRQPMSAPDLDAIRARLDAYNAADTSKEFIDCDTDLRRHAPADLAALLAEVKRLTRWKAEATEVISAWEAIHGDLGEPGVLGESKAAATRAEVKRLAAERDREKDRADRHGPCVGCFDAPEEHCPQHGRPASEWCEIASGQIGRANTAEHERDEARAALAALRGDVEHHRRTIAVTAEVLRVVDQGQGDAVEACAVTLAAVLANHPTMKEADR